MLENGIHWRTFRDRRHSLKRVHMKIRPADYKSQGEAHIHTHTLLFAANKNEPHLSVTRVGITEDNIDYTGNDIDITLNNTQPDVESCRASCRSKGAKFFTWVKPSRHPKLRCFCKTSNSGRVTAQDVVSGEVGSGGFPDNLLKTIQ